MSLLLMIFGVAFCLMVGLLHYIDLVYGTDAVEKVDYRWGYLVGVVIVVVGYLI